MLLEYSSAQCGAGKTTSLLTELATVPGRYIYAVDRREVIPARHQMIVDAASNAGLPPPTIVEIVASATSTNPSEADRFSVKARIEDIPRDYDGLPHVVVIITHRGMTLSQFDIGFRAFEIVVDEDPSLFSHTSVRTPASGPLFASMFDLVPIDGFDDRSRIVPKPTCPSVGDFRNDHFLAGMAEVRHAAEHAVLLTAEKDWTNVLAGQAWSFWTVWPLTALASFRRVRVVANEFDQRLNHRIATTLFSDEITMQPFALAGTPPVWASRNVTIRYFTDSHRAGSTFFQTREGRRNLDRIAEWTGLQGYANAGHYWCANKAYDPPADVTIPGMRVSSKVAGRNDLRACSAVTVLYSAKGSSSEVEAIELLTGRANGAAAIERDRETEDLIQIVLRSSLRDPGNGADVTLNVYDRSQAEALRAYLERSAYGCGGRISLVLEDVGLVDPVRERAGRKALPEGTSKSAAERAKAYRERQKAQKARAKGSVTALVRRVA